MKRLINSCVIAAAVLLAACDSSDSVKWHGGENIKTIESIDFSASENAANEALNKFSFDLFNSASNLYKDCFRDTISGNMTMSPLSLAINLSLRAASFDNETEESTLLAMGIKDLDTLCSLSNKLMRFLPAKINGGETILANSVWYNNIYEPSPSYIKLVNKTFYGDVVGFDASAPTTVQALIDSWCSENTRGIIPNFPIEFDNDIVTIMLNAMYYAGEWLHPFDPSQTVVADFNGTNGMGKCKMMKQSFLGHPYYSNDSAEATVLYYNGANRMIIIMPKDNISIEEFSNNFKYEDYKALLSKTEAVNMNLCFPKFDDGSKIKMNALLSALGIKSINMMPSKMGINNMCSSSIAQIAKIQVDEEGTKATAVTGSTIDTIPFFRTVTMNFDRPFLYFIENSTTGTILMAGRICNLKT